MNKYTDYFGIDISKDSFDVINLQGKHFLFQNDKNGFSEFLKIIPKGSLCVMEVTGIYHLHLANFLHLKNIAVSVVNPLRIKRFSQMHLRRNKTDKADAKMISLYAQTQDVDLWTPPHEILDRCKDIYQVMEQYVNIKKSLNNKLVSLKYKKSEDFLIDNISNQIQLVTEAIEELELELIDLIKGYNLTLFSNLKSIVGIGNRTAILLIITTNGFKHFENAKQLSSYFGFAPTELSSGKSIRGSRKISKMGNPLVREKLYMCSLQAFRSNKACSELYQRLIAKGKPKKLALIAVANKLLKIAYAIAKSGLPYDPEYKSVRIIS